jgi:RecA/RadA recombinase
MAVQACLPVEEGGLGGCVVYIDTEAAFSPKRYTHGRLTFLAHYFDLTHMVD